MIVCHCRVVTDRVVSAAVQQGARNLADLCRSTGAGGGCGGCVFSLRQLLCRHVPGEDQGAELTVTEVAGAAS